MRRLLKWVVIIGIVLLLGIQLIPVNRTNPPVTREIAWDSPQTRTLSQRACMDCHSNETVWPVYSRIAPVSLLLSQHVIEGRGRLNFSEWNLPQSRLNELEEKVRNGQMPPWDYLLMHPDAKLTAAEKEQLLAGFQATFQKDPPVPGRRGGSGRGEG